jgi:hypothetical protein
MKKLIGFINRNLTHNRDEAGDFGIRVVIHIPIGFVMSLPLWGWGLTYLFWKYQKNEDGYYHDGAWKDVFGAMAGFVAGIAVQLIILAILIRR